MKRIRIVVLAAVLMGALVPATAVEAHSTATVTFSGGGFGHAVGMSQYGANALAIDGRTAAEIIDFYYTDVALQDHTGLFGATHPLGSVSPDIWVGLDQDITAFTFEIPDGGGGVDLCLSGDGTGDCPKPDAQPAAGETWEFGTVAGSDGASCEFRRVSPGPLTTPAATGTCSASLSWGTAGLADYVTVDGIGYEHGTVRIRQGADQLTDGTFHLVLQVPLEQYLLGIREVPLAWPQAALEAQVLAARTYAAYRVNVVYSATDTDVPVKANINSARKSLCYCHLYPTPVDQNYRGLENLQLNPTDYPDWEAAVTATEAQTVTYIGALAQAFYSSSTGGFTENSEDVWVATLPYTRSVADPWSVAATSGNPLATWEIAVSVSTIEAVLGFTEITNIELANAAPDAAMVVTGIKDGVESTGTYSIAKRYSSLGLLSPSVSGLVFDNTGDGTFAFNDISESVHWKDINAIAALGITKGCNPPENTNFCPRNTVTRGQMAAFLTRALSLPKTEQDFFNDDGASIFENDINRLVASAGTDLACANNQFCPNDAIRRDDMALFLQRALDLTADGPVAFVDVVGNPHEAEINTIGNAGISLGCNPPDNDEFCPNRSVLRQEMASFLVRALAHAAAQ